MVTKNLTRRQFMATVTAGAGTVLLGNAINASNPVHVKKTVDPLKKVTLGRTGIQTTLLGMGTGYNGYNRSSSITRSGIAESIIRLAYDKGIRFFDCADSYGTNPFTGAALKGIPRESYTLSSKMWITQGGIPDSEKAETIKVIDRFRKEMNTDYIDLVQIHCMTNGEWTKEHRKTMDDLENLKAAQKCAGIDPTKSYYLYGHELIVMPRMRRLYDEDVAQQRYG